MARSIQLSHEGSMPERRRRPETAQSGGRIASRVPPGTDLVEWYFERGWTDGLPVVPPTREAIDAVVAMLGGDPDLVECRVPPRLGNLTREVLAINLVMAGCKPEYAPVVRAALLALTMPAFNLNGVQATTHMAAPLLIVNGPEARRIGMNGGVNAFGSGNRANATIGRALRLVSMNVLGSKPGESDASSFGHPGKFTLCFAEDPPPEPWAPLRRQLGYFEDDTTVTMVAVEGPHQLAQQLTDSAADVLRSFATSIRHPTWFATGKQGHGALLLGPEHAGFCLREGWTQQQVREYVYDQARVPADELIAAGVHLEENAQHDMHPDADGKLATIRSPDDVLLVTAGGEGAGWSAWLPAWAPTIHAYRATRRVRPAGEPLPECGPEGCLVPWMR
jgi:hypothetical protein